MMKRHTMRATFIWAIVLPGAVLTLLIVSTLTFGLLFSYTGDSKYQSLLFIVDSALLFAYVIISVFEVRRLHEFYQQGLFEISRDNFLRLSRGESDIRAYPSSRIEELKELNAAVGKVKERWSHSVLYSSAPDYDTIGLSFVDRERRLIAAREMSGRLDNLIHLSDAFTIGLMELYYDLGEEKLDAQEKDRLLDLANRYFAFIPGRLFAFGLDERSLICYLPGIDSLRIIKEKFVAMQPEASVSKRLVSGMSLLPLKGSMVCYPYSGINELLSDLRYAKRQNKSLTVFLPEERRKNGKVTLKDHADNVAFFNKAVLPIRHLSGNMDEKEVRVLRKVAENVADYIGTDFNGLYVHDMNAHRYFSLFEEDDRVGIPEDMVKEIVSIVDEDNTFYFSTRSACSEVIARRVDEYGVKSGFLYAFFDGQECIGILFMGKRDGDLVLDAYVKEALVRLGDAYTSYFFLAEKQERANAFQAEAENILGVSPYMVYKVDEASLNLTYFSPNMKAYFPSVELGVPCYQALYGLEKPCAHCPMKEFAKMQSNKKAKVSGRVKDIRIETSLALNDRKSHVRTLLIERLDQGQAGSDPYDKDWMVYSYHTLLQQLQNAYLIHSRGYLLLLSIDNLEQILTLQGGEGACFMVRALTQKIKSALNTHDVYAYNPSTLAILLPRAGHVELIDICEKIYDISKERFLDDGEHDWFTLTYLPLGFPRGHNSASDFLAHVEEYYRNGEYTHGKDFIYFHDHSIARSASRRDYMLAVIDEVFGTKTANCVYLQPMVLSADKKIYGAEILLRVEDTQRHTFFRADALSKVAEQNNRISLITESLLNFVGELYKEHGNSLFALNGFRRIGINVDAAFLKDALLAKKVAELYAEQHLGKDFLSFEVPEDLITDSFEAEGNAFANSGALLVCDRYTGKYVSLEKLKSYGFREVKLPREMIDGIELDAQKLGAVTSLVARAKSLGLRVSAVGVENSAQYLALKDLDPNMLLQGYHFYKPLSRSDLISAVISNNR